MSDPFQSTPHKKLPDANASRVLILYFDHAFVVTASLRTFEIWLQTTTDGVSRFCAGYQGPPRPVAVSRVRCDHPPVRGQYVTLQAINEITLALCEVQVFAQRK